MSYMCVSNLNVGIKNVKKKHKYHNLGNHHRDSCFLNFANLVTLYQSTLSSFVITIFVRLAIVLTGPYSRPIFYDY